MNLKKRQNKRKPEKEKLMKAKKYLFLTAGILNTILGGFGAILGSLMGLCNSLIRQMFDSSFEIVESFIQDLASADADYEYLLTADRTETLDFVMKSVTIITIVFIVLGLLYVLFGIFNILLSKRFAYVLKSKKYLGILLVVASWLLLWFNIMNILTTIAVFLKPKKQEKEYKLYSAQDGNSHNA